MDIPGFLSEGGLTVRLEVSPEGLLLGVHLPQTPPRTLRPSDFEHLSQTLQSFPLAPARDERDAAFRSALRRIPTGETRSYGALAHTLRSSPRAIASRCAANRLLLVLPCHRIVGKHSLGGYQLGLEWKIFLLELERAIATHPSDRTNLGA